MLHAQRGELGFITLHGPKSTSSHCSEWMSSRCQTQRPWPYLCPYYKNVFGGQGWPTRWDNLLGPAHTACSMRVASTRSLYAPLWLLLPWISCMLTSQALRPHWSQTGHLESLINGRSMLTKMVLQQKDRCSEPETCWPGKVKADAFKGKRKIKDRWEEETWEVVHQIMTDVPSYNVTNQQGKSQVLHWNWLLIVSEVGIPLCIGICHAWDGCTSPTPHKPTSMGGEMKMTPQEFNGSTVIQQPTSRTSLGWIKRKLWLLPWTSARASTKDGWGP